MLSSLKSFFAWSHFRRCWLKGFGFAILLPKCSPGTIGLPARAVHCCCFFTQTLTGRLSSLKSIGLISTLFLLGKTCYESASVTGTEMPNSHEGIWTTLPLDILCRCHIETSSTEEQTCIIITQ